MPTRHERLKIDEEDVVGTSHPKIFINKIADRPAKGLREALERLCELSQNGHERELRSYLNDLLPEAKLSAQANGEDILSENVPEPVQTEISADERLNLSSTAQV